MGVKIIITGVTGFVGEGVLLECLQHPNIMEILIVSRKPSRINHPKIKQCLIPDFLNLEQFRNQLTAYDACFYCAGVSSRGLSEKEYHHVTYTTTIYFAEELLSLNPNLIFCFISGNLTDSSEKGSLMWARIKGKTENDLLLLPFKKVYNFRPGFMKPTLEQKNIKRYYRVIGSLYPLLHVLFPNQVSTMKEVGLAMINSVINGYHKSILEIEDIKALSKF